MDHIITNSYSLFNVDCLKVMPYIKDKSVDLVLVDPPYNTTPLYWDKSIPFTELWKEYHRIAKPDAAIAIFAQEPFASFVRMSNLKEYRYDWYWQKERLTNVFQVKRRPGKTIENICIFYREQCLYNPQKHEHIGNKVTNKIGDNARWSVTQSGYNQNTKPLEYIDDGTRHPTQLLRFNRDNVHERLHPTQKPVALLEYLIKTYTDEGDVILDPTMGSGSCGEACLNTGRKFIGIELDTTWFNFAKERIENHVQ